MTDKVKIPSGQRVWQTVYDGGGNIKWVIASDEGRTKYHLYFCGEEKPKRVKTASSPEPFFAIMRGEA